MTRTGGCCGVLRVSMTTSHKILIAEDNLPGAELLEAYKKDAVTAEDYHRQRVKILGEP